MQNLPPKRRKAAIKMMDVITQKAVILLNEARGTGPMETFVITVLESRIS
jgi:hypothetical protein